VETRIDDDFITKVFSKVLPKRGYFKNLRDLDFSHNILNNSYPLLMSTLQINCGQLNNLSLASCRFFDQTKGYSFELPKIYLDPQTQITPGFLYLRRLDLTSSLKGDEQVSQLANSPAFKYLEYLKLKNCGITNSGFTAIVGSRHLRRLKVLIISKNQLTKLVFPIDDFKSANKAQL